jgi:hypothetical protein
LVVTVVVVRVGTTAAATAIPSVGSIQGENDPAGHGIPVLIAGDSTALTLAQSLYYWSTVSKSDLAVIDKGTVGCGIAEGQYYEMNGTSNPVPNACNPDAPPSAQWPALLKDRLVRYRPRVVVLLAGRWEVFDRTNLAGQVTNITHPSYAHYVRGQIQRFVSIASSDGAKVVLMTAPYYDSGEQPDGQPLPEDSPVRVRDYNQLIRKVASANPQVVAIVDLNAIVSPQGRFTTTIGAITVRAPDGVHFPFFDVFDDTAPLPDTAAQTEQFARWIGPKILPTLEAAAHH